MPLELEEDECPHCGDPVLISKRGELTTMLQLEEVEGIDQDGHAWRGHERHWKYCTARPTTGSASAEPPEEPPDEPDKPLSE